MNPSSAVLRAGQSQPFALMVSGTPAANVKWTLNPQVGGVSLAGVYSAPTFVSAPQTVVVTGKVGNTICGTATVSLVPAAVVSVTVSPTAVTLNQSGSQQFAASVVGSTNQSIKWTVSPTVGTLSTNGASAVYTAPSDFETQQVVEVTATSMADGTKLARALITLLPIVSVSVYPVSADVPQGGTQQFSATVKGAANKDVTWSLDPAVGTVSPGGLYTAPSDASAGAVLNVIAQANSDKAKKAIGSVKIVPSDELKFTVGPNGLETLIFRGVDYNYRYDEGLMTLLFLTKPSGETYTVTPVCNRTLAGNTVTQDCNAGGNSVLARAVFSRCGVTSVCADLSFANKSTTTITKALLSVFGIRTAKADFARSTDAVDIANPVRIFNYVDGQWLLWIADPSPDKSMFNPCGYSYICKHQPQFLNVGPGETRQMRVVARVTSDAGASSLAVAPEAYAAIRSAEPPVIQWPDRRPIMTWFIGEFTKRSVLNPRGYLQDPTLDVSNLATFRKRVLDAANWARAAMDARPVRPQGLILWDLEGQEFAHSTTYVGDPTVFSKGYAPEMNAVADDLFRTFREAGYKVGITLRPQYLNWGKQVPSTCHYDDNYDYRDYFIKVDAPFRQKYYACFDPQGKYSPFPDGTGGQTVLPKGQNDQVLALLKRKVQYAKDRWGATLFYVDSAVWSGGAPIDASIFRDLQRTYPDSLFIPEQEYLLTMSAAIPFSDPRNPGDARLAPLTWRWVYPNAAIAIRLPDCQGTCWAENRPVFTMGQKIGDIALYNYPGQMDMKQLEAIESMIQDARHEASTVVVTRAESGATLQFSGNPASVTDYPVKLRVYFAKSTAELETSTLFCEAGQWLGENTCNLDLRGITLSQIKYYDFADHFVKAEEPAIIN